MISRSPPAAFKPDYILGRKGTLLETQGQIVAYQCKRNNEQVRHSYRSLSMNSVALAQLAADDILWEYKQSNKRKLSNERGNYRILGKQHCEKKSTDYLPSNAKEFQCSQ